MKINKLTSNNIINLDKEIKIQYSTGIAGLSGSGKTSFCDTLANEVIRRIVLLLPKSEYQFLFPELIKSNFSATKIENMPFLFFLKKKSISTNPRSTIGTHTKIFNEIRRSFAGKHNFSSDFFSFNNEMNWCSHCKGRGVFRKSTCTKCNGKRYKDSIGKYKLSINGVNYDIRDINSFSIIKIIEIKDKLALSSNTVNILKNIIAMNIGYLSLDRIMSTLSGGELTRLYLAEFMAQSKNCVIIIDELSVGLDKKTLCLMLRQIEKLGGSNVIWLIDHSNIVVNATKEKIYFGPKSGEDGGCIVDKSPRPIAIDQPINDDQKIDYFILQNLKYRNLDIEELKLPKNRLISITGESGCGKSTLVENCFPSAFEKKYKKEKIILIAQDRNQSITSKSTILTFLDFNKNLNQYLNKSVNSILNKKINLSEDNFCKLEFIHKLGLGYLTLNRQINTLSTGEFQCIHLITEFFSIKDKDVLFVLDEPSKGLSQNILNSLMVSIRKILQNPKATVIMIEHNDYMLKNSDYIIDFKKRKPTVTKLEAIKNKEWLRTLKNNECSNISIPSKIDNFNGITFLKNNGDEYFQNTENDFYGGMLRRFSQTANWIYSNFSSSNLKPKIPINLEGTLYSHKTFLFELAGIINRIILLSDRKERKKYLDYYNRENHCKCCKGKGEIDLFPYDIIITKPDKTLWDGMIDDKIIQELKRYNFSKIKFLFKEIKKLTNCDLNKAFKNMSKIEKKYFLYGYWDKKFYDKSKQTTRMWKGIIYLVQKYLRGTKLAIREDIKNKTQKETCPICDNNILNQPIDLEIKGKNLSTILKVPIKENQEIFSDIPIITHLISILGDNIPLNIDVSTLDINTQVELKLLELEYSSFSNFEIVLNNYLPFKSFGEKYIKNISKVNKVTITDSREISKTKTQMQKEIIKTFKIKSSSVIYELLGYKGIKQKINKIRKANPCPNCNGKKVIRIEGIDDNIDVLITPCEYCFETGISISGLNIKIDDVSVKVFETEKVEKLTEILHQNKNIELISKIRLNKKLSELNKNEIYNLYRYMELSK